MGEEGHVTMHNHSLWYPYFESESKIRLANNRLTNVSLTTQDVNNTVFNKEQFDVAVIILGLHDLYLEGQTAEGGKAFNVPSFLQAVFEAIKPGGVLGIIEHQSISSQPPQKPAFLHRLDSQVIVSLLEEVGFELEARSAMLENKNDDRILSALDPRIRRKTDRAVLKFRKPSPNNHVSGKSSIK